jgi:NhaA family Na+:H+ antiporter
MTEIAEVTEDVRPAGLTLEKYLHPTQVFVVLPLFAFFNAGVAINRSILDAIMEPVTLGIIIGLFVGKQIGVLGASWIAVKSGYGNMPDGVNWGQIWGAGGLAGVGFTMSLFITELAFKDPSLVSQAKIGILIASLISGVFGYIILSMSLPRSTGESPR